MESLLKNCLISKSFDYQAASGTEVTTAAEIDMASPTEGTFDSVCFIAVFSEVTTTAVITLKALCGDVAGLASGQAYATTTATATATGDDTDDNILVLDCVKPGKRYIRPDLDIATANAALDCIIAIRYNGRKMPTPVLAALADGEISVNMG
jgi:hypothetical protein